jgi:hypothetical protein
MGAKRIKRLRKITVCAVVAVVMQSQRLKGLLIQNKRGVLKMETKMMKYLILLKTVSGKGGEFWEGFSKMPTAPMPGVMIESSWSLFGYWDFALFIKADSNENALHFVGEKLRALNGVGETSTTPMTVLKEHKM